MSIVILCLVFIATACRKPDECIPACANSYFLCIKGVCVCPGIVLDGHCRHKLPGYVYGTVECGCVNDVGFSFNPDGTVFMTYLDGTLTADYSIEEDGSFSFFYFEPCTYGDIETDFIRHNAEPVENGMQITTQYITSLNFEVVYECTSFFEE